MRSLRWQFLMLFLGSMVVCVPLGNAADKSAALSLPQALRLAYKRHPQMQAARQLLQAGQGRASQMKALPNPEGEISMGGFRKDESGQKNSEVNRYAVKQPLGAPGTQVLNWQTANQEVETEKASLDLAWGRVRTQVIQLYSRLLFQKKVVEISRNNLEVTRQFVTLVENRFQSGDALKTELIRAKMEVSKAENDVLVSRKNLSVLAGEFNLALGFPLKDAVELADIPTDILFEEEYDDLLDQALAGRADIRMAESQLTIARNHLAGAYLETFLPELSVGFERTMEDYENDAALTLEFSYPLWGFHQGKIKETKAIKVRRTVERDALKQQVSLEVYQAFSEMELAKKQVHLSRKALEEANELLRQITMSYQEGDMPFMTFLENLKAVKETRLAFLEAVYTIHETFAHLQMLIQDTPIPEEYDEK